MHKYKILGIVANHTNSLVKYNVSINNLSIIKEYLSGLCIVDTISEKYANLLRRDLTLKSNIVDYYYLIENNDYFDFGKWIYALENVNHEEYDYILFINDSILLNENIDKFFIHINYSLSDKINLFAYNDSTEYRYHYQSYLFLLNAKIISKFVIFFNSKKKHVNNLNSLVHNVELCICDIDDNHDCFIKIANDYNMDKNIFWENEVLYQYLLSKNIFGIMKLKKLFNYKNYYKISIYGDSFENFNYYFYRNNYSDLSLLNDSELINHFITIGQYEGRICDYNTMNILPQYYRDKLEKLGLLYFFDIPEDFDIYYYKQHNSDIKHLSNFDSIIHYITNGIYEGRNYGKNKITKDNIINNFYKNSILKLNILDSVSIPDNFNCLTHILFNNQYDTYSNIGTIINYNISNNIVQLYKREDFDKHLINLNLENYRKENKLRKMDDIHTIQHYFNLQFSKNNLYKIPEDFDIKLYQKLNPELEDLTDKKVIEHYIKIGRKENRIYKLPNDFNHNTYQKIYNDLKGLNKNSLEEHYLMIGYKENRVYNIPNNFNINHYKKIYKNIDNLNLKEIETMQNQYINNGLPADFDCMTYAKIYSDLTKLNRRQLENHYIKYGKNEGRHYKLPDDFDATEYKKINKDLDNLNEEELKEHFLFIGLNSGRIYKLPDDFNSILYKQIYTDLNKLNEEQLKEHYLYNGYSEKRIYKLPHDFDTNSYKKINKELDSLTENELKEHYLYKGISDKKIYKLPYDFDPNIYNKIFKDLSHLTYEQLKDHYLYNGNIEKRIYKLTTKEEFDKFVDKYHNINDIDFEAVNILFTEIEHNSSSIIDITNNNDIEYTINKNELTIITLPKDFNPAIYRKANKDLTHLSDQNLKKHYLEHGYKEKRIYNLPKDFDTTVYKILNKDLIHLSDDNLKQHYLEYGYKEKRSYKA